MFQILGKRVLTYHPRWGDQFLPLRPKDAMRQVRVKISPFTRIERKILGDRCGLTLPPKRLECLQGFFRDVEVFMGVNRDEGSIFLANTMPEIFMKGPLPNITRDEASLYMVFFFQYILR